MNDAQKDATYAFTEKALKILCDGPAVLGACIILLQRSDGTEAISTIAMQFPSVERGNLPSLFRDIAFTVEKENLLSGVKTESLGEVETTVLKKETRPH